MRLRDKLINFMYGRNGVDEFTKTLSILFIILWVVNLFIRSYILSLVTLGIVIYCTFRMLSKNIYKRRNESAKFVSIFTKVKQKFRVFIRRFKDIKVYRYRTCPVCKKTLRLPKKRGTHTASCPNCKSKFKVHILL